MMEADVSTVADTDTPGPTVRVLPFFSAYPSDLTVALVTLAVAAIGLLVRVVDIRPLNFRVIELLPVFVMVNVPVCVTF